MCALQPFSFFNNAGGIAALTSPWDPPSSSGIDGSNYAYLQCIVTGGNQCYLYTSVSLSSSHTYQISARLTYRAATADLSTSSASINYNTDCSQFGCNQNPIWTSPEGFNPSQFTEFTTGSFTGSGGTAQLAIELRTGDFSDRAMLVDYIRIIQVS